MSKLVRVRIFVTSHPLSRTDRILGRRGNKVKGYYRVLVDHFFGAIHPQEYEVVYSLHPRGPFKVRFAPEWGYVSVRVVGGTRHTPVCFLPRTWGGKRVKRTVFVGTKEWKPRRKK